MPVLIRNNDATELCITKGQEARVVGWQSSVGNLGQDVLETLFVELCSPPSAVKIDGLPPNVVPISKTSHTITVTLNDDSEARIVREQVNVLPNFSITDYASQGKTRPINVVDLQHSSNHQSYYTCLSRSASAEGTAILQSFDPRKITGGASGWLRQEFRCLELLDEISRLQYEGNLPISFQGETRNSLIEQFQLWKGNDYVPEHVHEALRWSASDPLRLDTKSLPRWEIVDRKKFKEEQKLSAASNLVAAEGSAVLPQSCKWKSEMPVENSQPKRLRLISAALEGSVRGIRWDEVNYSCAYDALYTVFFNIWFPNPLTWNKRFKANGVYMSLLVDGFQKVYNQKADLESVRDSVRAKLNSHSPMSFPYGQAGTSVSDLANTMVGNSSDCDVWMRCTECKCRVPTNHRLSKMYITLPSAETSAEWMNIKLSGGVASTVCPACSSVLDRRWHCDSPPKLMILDIQGDNMKLSSSIRVMGKTNLSTLRLRGIVYHGAFHFTAAIIDTDSKVWFY
ncbi:hypothetical protein BJ138DRAFT_1013461, partial [Hygrophoropsis aurantiaca]